MIEDNIRLSPVSYSFDFAGHVLCVMVKNKVRSQFLGLFSFRFFPYCSNDFCSYQFRYLNGGASNTTPCCPHKNGLSRLQVCSSYQHMPGCQEDEWDRGCLFERKLVRSGKNI